MARRELEEINAGSMADIAFLLLIFFIVTTTMDLEAGIPKTLPMKVELPDDFPLPPTRMRDVFSINVNANDQLLVENENLDISQLEEKLYYFYTANMYSPEKDPTQVEYFLRDIAGTKQELGLAKQELAKDEDNIFLKSAVSKLEKRLAVLEAMPDGKFLEINEQAAIQLKQKAGTSYGVYIAIINHIGKVVNKVKDERSKEIFNGTSFYDLDPSIPEDNEKIKILDIMVPDRLLEPAITN